MYISVTDGRRRALNAAFAYLAASVFCALFGAVYENYSHGVYSWYMLYAFAFPLAGGALPLFGMALYGGCRMPGRAALNLYGSGIAALTVGSLFRGALEIYGTESPLALVYPAAGLAFCAAGLAVYLLHPFFSKRG